MMSISKRIFATTLGLVLGCGVAATADDNSSSVATSQNDQAARPVDMKKLSEAFGNFIGRNLQSPGLSFDIDGIIQGIRDGAAGKPSPLSEKEYEEMMTAVQEKAFKEMSAGNLKAANDFMAKNKGDSGVIEVVPGKLQFLVLKEGNGAVVDPHTSPKINYTGKYQDGTVFGTSEEMGGPITIPLDQTIPGFSKGIVGMKEGEKRRLFVHPDLGYGTSGQLPPNELLIFDVEVVKAGSADAKEKGKSAVNDAGALTDNDDGDEDDDDLFADDDEEDTSPAKDNVK